jgi:hypothetical protein
LTAVTFVFNKSMASPTRQFAIAGQSNRTCQDQYALAGEGGVVGMPASGDCFDAAPINDGVIRDAATKDL